MLKTFSLQLKVITLNLMNMWENNINNIAQLFAFQMQIVLAPYDATNNSLMQASCLNWTLCFLHDFSYSFPLALQDNLRKRKKKWHNLVQHVEFESWKDPFYTVYHKILKHFQENIKHPHTKDTVNQKVLFIRFTFAENTIWKRTKKKK